MKGCPGRLSSPCARIAVPARHLALRRFYFAMSKHLQRDIDALNTELLSISSMVEEMIDKATQALASRRYDLADEVVKSDEYVDRHEVHVEEELEVAQVFIELRSGREHCPAGAGHG